MTNVIEMSTRRPKEPKPFKMVKVGDFCTVVSNKRLKDSGLKTGDEVYVITQRALPVKRSDPYLQRVYSVVVKVSEEGSIMLPNSEGEDNGNRSIIVDPRNLEKVSEERGQQLEQKLEEDFSD